MNGEKISVKSGEIKVVDKIIMYLPILVISNYIIEHNLIYENKQDAISFVINYLKKNMSLNIELYGNYEDKQRGIKVYFRKVDIKKSSEGEIMERILNCNHC